MKPLPDLSLSLLERCFARTFQALLEGERVSFARELSRIAASGGVRELRGFPSLLAGKKWPTGRGFIPDLALLELELKLASLAPEVQCRGFERVPTAAEPDWYAARFRFDPGHRLLDSDWPLHLAFADPKASFGPSPSTILIYRGEGKAHFRPLGENEAALIRSLQLGVPLGKVLERKLGPDFDAMTFHRWMESGLLRAIDWAPV